MHGSCWSLEGLGDLAVDELEPRRLTSFVLTSTLRSASGLYKLLLHIYDNLYPPQILTLVAIPRPCTAF